MTNGVPERGKDKVAVIRQIVKGKCPSLHVRNGRGTGWGYVKISGSLESGHFIEAEKRTLESLGLSYCLNFAVIAPEDRASFIEHRLKR